MASFARSLRIARTALPRPTSSFTPLTSIRHASSKPNAAQDQSFPSYPNTTDPNDPRHGKNLKGESVEGVGDPAKFKNPNMVTEDGDAHSSIPGETHAKDGGADSYVPLVSSPALSSYVIWTNNTS